MGDHRIDFKIEMTFHGIKDTYEAYLNFWSTEVGGVDDRILKFMRSVYDRGMEVYRKDMEKYYEREVRERKENQERQELARLKAKYEK